MWKDRVIVDKLFVADWINEEMCLSIQSLHLPTGRAMGQQDTGDIYTRQLVDQRWKLIYVQDIFESLSVKHY